MRRRARPEPTPERPTPASAYHSDMADGRKSIAAIDGPAIIIATIVDQILLATDDDAPRSQLSVQQPCL